jgi:hypothetical protein
VPPKRIAFFKPSKELRKLIASLNVNAPEAANRDGI